MCCPAFVFVRRITITSSRVLEPPKINPVFYSVLCKPLPCLIHSKRFSVFLLCFLFCISACAYYFVQKCLRCYSLLPTMLFCFCAICGIWISSTRRSSLFSCVLFTRYCSTWYIYKRSFTNAWKEILTSYIIRYWQRFFSFKIGMKWMKEIWEDFIRCLKYTNYEDIKHIYIV